jgi:hypothetical protein
MKTGKYKNKYRKFQKAIIAGASTGVVTGLIVMGAATPALAQAADSSASVPAYTQDAKTPPMHMMRRWKSGSRVKALAESLGLDSAEVLSEIRSGKDVKQILQEHGIDLSDLNRAFGGSKP